MLCPKDRRANSSWRSLCQMNLPHSSPFWNLSLIIIILWRPIPAISLICHKWHHVYRHNTDTDDKLLGKHLIIFITMHNTDSQSLISNNQFIILLWSAFHNNNICMLLIMYIVIVCTVMRCYAQCFRVGLLLPSSVQIVYCTHHAPTVN